MPQKHKHNLQHHRKHHKPKGVTKKAYDNTYWPFLPIALIVALLLAISPMGQRHTAARTSLPRIPGKVLAYSTSMSVSGLVSQTNSQRSANGAAALTNNGQLNAAAQNKANDMATRNYWSHNTPEGSPPWIFVSAQGYSYQKIGENLAAGFSDEAATINGWMNSAGHRANMLDTNFTEVGFGFANNANYTSAGGGPMTIVVAFYGKPTGASQPVTPPPAPTPAPAPAPVATPAPAPSPTTPVDSAPVEPAPPNPEASPAPPESDEENTENNAVTTASPPGTEPPTQETSQLQTIIADPSLASFGVSALSIGMVLAAGVWVSRHALRVRRFMRRGEKFVVHHPILDIAVLALIALAFAMTQTAGLIK